MPTSSPCRATSWPTPRCRRPPRPAPAMPTCASTAITTEVIQLRDGELETAVIDREIGLAVRVIVDGTWGFASHAELAPDGRRRHRAPGGAVATTLARAERRAHRAGARTGVRRRHLGVELRDRPVHRPRPPTRSRVLEEYSGRLLAADGVDHVSAGLNTVKEQTFYADTFGSSITQQRVRVMPVAGGGDRRRRGGQLRVDAHAGAADGPRLGGAGRRRRVELDRRAGRSCRPCWPRRSRRPA